MQLAHEYTHGALVDLPIYDTAAMTKGQGLIWGADATSTAARCALIDCAAVPIDVFAVLAESVTLVNAATNIGTPIIYRAKVQLVNMVPVWKVYWDLAAANDIDTVSSTSTVVTHASGDDNLDGSWIYINSGTGAGQLRYIKAANATTKTVNTAFTTTPDSTSDFVLIRNQGLPTGGQDLDTTFSMLKTAVSATGQLLILKNFIEGPTGTHELNVTLNSDLEMNGLNSRGVRFFSHVIFMDTYFSVDSI